MQKQESSLVALAVAQHKMILPTNTPTPRATKTYKERSVPLAYDLIINGVVSQFNDAVRSRMGVMEYPVYADKIEGYSVEKVVTGATGTGKGGLMFTDPDISESNRNRIIVAFNNVVYLYTIDTETLVVLRDIGTIDSATISFLSGALSKDNAYFAIGSSAISTYLFKYSGTSTGSITAFADAGGGEVTVTSASHPMQNGNTVTITGTTNYNGTYIISGVAANTYNITATWVSDDATGTWTGETLVKTAETGLNASKYLGFADDRLGSSGVGNNQTVNQYSHQEPTGDFTTFATGTGETDGGRYSGNVGATTAMQGVGGYMVVFERKRIGVHQIRTETQGTGYIKSTSTIREDLSLEGVGASSPKSVVEVDGTVFFVTPQGETFEWNIDFSRDRLKSLNKHFLPFLSVYDFENAAIGIEYKKKLLLVSCAAVSGGFLDTLLIYSLKTKTWSIDNGKNISQFFWDDLGEQLYGLSSITNEIHKVFDGTYENDENPIELSVETRMIEGGVEEFLKDFINNHIIVGAESSTQTFTFEFFTDQDENPTLTIVKSAADLVNVSQSVSGKWGVVTFGGGAKSDADSANTLQRLYFFNERLIDRFTRMSVRIKESSSFRSVAGLPSVRYRSSDFPKKSF